MHPVSDAQNAAHRTWVGSILLCDIAGLTDFPLNTYEIKETR